MPAGQAVDGPLTVSVLGSQMARLAPFLLEGYYPALLPLKRLSPPQGQNEVSFPSSCRNTVALYLTLRYIVKPSTVSKVVPIEK